MAHTLEFIDEVDQIVITIAWDDLHSLPDLSVDEPRVLRSRRASPAESAINFLEELRRLNGQLLLA